MNFILQTLAKINNICCILHKIIHLFQIKLHHMKTNIFSLSLKICSVFLLLLFSNCKKNDSTPNKSSHDEFKIENQATNIKQLRHVVLFKFKDSASTKDIEKVIQAFTDLPNKIPEIKGFEWGLNNSPENLNKGFTHSFFITFDNEADREIYLPHPDHKAFVEIVGPVLDDVLVIDYFTK